MAAAPAALLFIFCFNAQAQSYTWNVPAGGNWSAAGSWTPAGGPPIAGDIATIGTINAGATITVNAASACTTLNITAGTSFTLTRSAANILTVSGSVNDSAPVGITHTVSAVIAGAATMNMTGAGILTLSGANTYTGVTTLSSGTLNINSTTAIGTGTFTIAGASTINNSTAAAITLTTNNVQNWNADFTFTGTQALNMGTGAVTLGATRTVTASASTLTVGGVISGAGFGLTKAGAGILILSGVNTYTGATTVNAGTLQAGSTQAFGVNSAVTMANVATAILNITGFNNSIGSLTGGGATGGNVVLGAATLTIGGDNTSPAAYAGVISGTGGITKTGTGTLTLGNAANTYTGTTTINNGIVSVGTLANGGANSSLGATAAATSILIGSATAATLSYTGVAVSTNRTITINGAGGGTIQSTAAVLTLAGNIANGGNLLTLDTNVGGIIVSSIISGAGGLTKTSAGTCTLSGANTFGGAATVTVSGGILSVNADARLGAAGNTVTLGGGTLQTTATFASARGFTLAAGDGTLDVAAGTTLTLSGVIGGANSLTKTSTGILTLSGVNTFGGGAQSFTIAAGTLSINAGTTLGNAATTLVLSDTSILSITAAGAAINNPVTLGAGATGITISMPLNTTSANPITINGVIAGGGGGQVLNIDNPAPGTGDGWLLLAGANTYVANIVMANAANLEFNSDASFGDVANALTMVNNNAIVAVGATTFAGNRTISINNSFFLSSAGTFWINSGVVSGTNLNVGYSDASGAFTGTVELSGNNTFGGTIAVRCGTLALANNNALGTPGTITMNGAGFNSAQANAALMIDGNVTIPQNITTTGNGASTNTIGSLSGTTGTFSGTVTMGSATFYQAATGSVVTFSNVISGAFAITAGTPTATGVLYFTAAETYSGTTTVNGGTLRLEGDTGTIAATTGLTLNFGGTFDIDNVGVANPSRIGNAVPLTFNGGTFSMTAPAGTDRTETVGQITFNSGDSSVILTPNGTGRVQLAGTGAFARNAGATVSYVRNTGGGTALGHFTSSTQAAGTVSYATVTIAGVTSAASYFTANAADGIVDGLDVAAPVFTSIANADWNTASTWNPLGPPTAGSVAIVKNTVTVNAAIAATPYSIDIIAGGSLSTTTAGPQIVPVGAGGIIVSSGVTTSIGGAANVLNVQSSTAELIVTVAGTGSLTVNNVITNTNTPGLTKSGTGTLTLKGVNTYTGTTTIDNGMLVVDGSIAAGSAVTLNGGTLGGTGTVGGAITASINGGIISPGDPTSSTGILNTGAVTLNAVSTYTEQLNNTTAGTGFDQLNVAGAINLGGSTLNATVGVGFLPANGTAFTIIASTGAVSGTFSGLPNNAIFPISGQNFKITYNANSVVLTRVIANYTWNGAGINNNWSTGFNWVGGVAPGIADGLIFGAPVAARKTTNNNNIAAGTSFNFIQFQSAGYILNGNSVTLTNGASAVNYSATAGTNTINNNIAFATNAPTISTIAGGTLNLNGNLDNGTFLLTVASAGSTTIAGVISNNGGLTSSGAGTVLLTGNNTYSGTTTISAGTLQVGNNGATGTLGTGSVTDNAALIFNRTNNVVLASAISGTGSFTQAGTGTVTLTGANTYSGTTTISGGTLQIGNNGTTGSLGTGAVTDNGALIFNRTDNITVANNISGTGSVSQSGTGTVTMNGTETYTGATSVNAGILQLDAALAAGAALTTVNNAATLDGTGTVRALTIAAGGAIEPGDAGATGILTASGATTFTNSASLFDVMLNGTTAGTGYDQLKVGGTLTLNNATLDVFLSAGFATTLNTSPNNSFTIISNTPNLPISGTFNNLPEGSLIIDSSGQQGFIITYFGGAGHDVVLHQVPILVSTLYVEAGGGLGSLGGVQAGDTVTLTFSVPVSVGVGGAPISDIGVPVTGDTWSTSTIAAQGPSRNITVTLGGAPLLTPAGTYSAVATSAGSPSGVFMAASTSISDGVNAVYSYPLVAGLPTAAAIAASVDLGPGGAGVVAVQWGDTFNIGPKTWSIGVADPSDVFTASTTLAGGYIVRNSGTSYSHFTILSDTVSSPSGWTLGAAAGNNQFSMLVDPSTPITGAFPLDLSVGPQTLAAGVYSGQTRNFDLRFTAPSSLTVGAGTQQTINVTIVISAP